MNVRVLFVCPVENDIVFMAALALFGVLTPSQVMGASPERSHRLEASGGVLEAHDTVHRTSVAGGTLLDKKNLISKSTAPYMSTAPYIQVSSSAEILTSTATGLGVSVPRAVFSQAAADTSKQ